jgi:hypothetical protein
MIKPQPIERLANALTLVFENNLEVQMVPSYEKTIIWVNGNHAVVGMDKDHGGDALEAMLTAIEKASALIEGRFKRTGVVA